MRSRFEVMADFYDNPDDYHYKELVSILTYYLNRGTMRPNEVEHILALARQYQIDGIMPGDK